MGGHVKWFLRKSKIHGVGAHTKRFIFAGELVAEVKGREYRFSELDGFRLSLAFQSRPDYYVVPDRRCAARYMNHSDTPNCKVEGLRVLAKSDIRADEELTIDYHETTTWKDYVLPWRKR